MIRCLSGIGRSYSESVRTISKSASVFLRASNRRSVKSSIEVMVLGFAAMGSPTPRLGFILLLLGYILRGRKGAKSHVFVTGYSAGSAKQRCGGWPFQHFGPGAIESSLRGCQRAEGASLSWFVRGRAGVCGNSSNCSSRAKFARGIRLPNFSERRSYAFPCEGGGSCESRV